MAYFREITEHYRIEKILGTRAGGRVFRASDPVTAAPVTLKLFPLADVPPESAQDFVRAMGILQALRHPSLPTLFDFGFTPDGHAFLVLEYVDGRGAEALQGGSPAQILPLLGQVLDGLERLHQEDLAHLNLAPENLLVVPGPAPGRIQMVGLGTAPLRAPGDRPEREAAAYAAPELSRPQDLALAPWRADLFSLALVTCRLLDARLDAGPGDPHALQVTFPLGVTFELEEDQILKEVLERALHRRPEERPGFDEMRRAFTRALVGTSGPRRLPESRIFLSPEPESEPWLPLPGPKAVPPLRDPLDDTHPVFHPAPAPAAPPPRTAPAATVPATEPETVPALVQGPTRVPPLPGRPPRRFLRWGGLTAAALAVVAALAGVAVGVLALRPRWEKPGSVRPPIVQIPVALARLEFEKGATVRIPFQITDDLPVKTMTVHVRAEGRAWTELPCNLSGADCTVEVAEPVHQNRTIELYAVATDLSGHQGRLGSAEKPRRIRRKP